MALIPFAPWLPDASSFETNASREALNVIPSDGGYRPFPSLVGVTTAITARARGAISVRAPDGSAITFCGDETKLYKMNSNGLGFTDVSRELDPYATPSNNWWTFTQYGPYVIAANGFDEPQIWNLASSTEFADLGGTPPNAMFAGSLREFGILARTDANNNKLWWSAIGDIEDWAASATTLSDAQEFPDGGAIMGFVGGEYGVVLQERAINRMTFDGPPTVFRFDKIASQLGCRAEGSVAKYENLIFFLSDDGFYMIRGGSEITPIGAEKVDRWIESDLDGVNLQRVSSAIDPINKIYVMGYPSKAASNGTPDSAIIFHWPTGQWSHARFDHEWLYAGVTQAAYTVDEMDTISATVDGLPYPYDSRFWMGIGNYMLSGFTTAHKQGVFSGANLEAKIETGDNQLSQGRRTLLRGLRPIVEGIDVIASVEIGARNSLAKPLAYTNPASINAYGFFNTRSQARYHRARMTLPAASSWTFARGVDDIKASPMGAR